MHPIGFSTAIFAVKAYQTDSAAAWLRAVANPAATVLVAQNGVEHRQRVAPYVGDAQVVLSKRARAATMAAQLFPELTARGLALVARFLPGPTGESGDANRSGWESRTKLAPSPLTTLLDHATEENNELRDHHSVEN